MRKYILLFTVVLPFLFAAGASADMIVVNSGNLYGLYSMWWNMGRGQGIKAEETFTVQSIGFYAQLNTDTYEIAIFDRTDTGGAGALLSSSYATLSSAGAGWYNIPINFTFTEDTDYIVHWRGHSGQNIGPKCEFYNPTGLPRTIGPITLLNGYFGYDPVSNVYSPSFRYDVVNAPVPLPAALWFLGSGLAGLAGLRRRFTK
jgi:hypothetical protein